MKRFALLALSLAIPLALVGCDKKTTNPPAAESKEEKMIKDNLAKLSPDDRALAEAQKFCVVLDESRLGSMGVPLKLDIDGKPVFICCEGCEEKAKKDPQATLAKLEARRKASPPK